METPSSAPFTSYSGKPLSRSSSLPTSQIMIAVRTNDEPTTTIDQLLTSTPTPTENQADWLGVSTAATEMVSSSKRTNGFLVLIVAMLAVVASVVIVSKHFFAKRSLRVFQKIRERLRRSDLVEGGTIHGCCESQIHAVPDSESQGVGALQLFLQCHEVGTTPCSIYFHERHAGTGLDSESELSCYTSDSGSTGLGSPTKLSALNECFEMTCEGKTPNQYASSTESSKWTTSHSCHNDGLDTSDYVVNVLTTATNCLLPLQVSLKSLPSQPLRPPVKDPLVLGDTESDDDDSLYPDRISV
jgi:hypothetical protein